MMASRIWLWRRINWPWLLAGAMKEMHRIRDNVDPTIAPAHDATLRVATSRDAGDLYRRKRRAILYSARLRLLRNNHPDPQASSRSRGSGCFRAASAPRTIMLSFRRSAAEWVGLVKSFRGEVFLSPGKRPGTCRDIGHAWWWTPRTLRDVPDLRPHRQL